MQQLKVPNLEMLDDLWKITWVVYREILCVQIAISYALMCSRMNVILSTKYNYE